MRSMLLICLLVLSMTVPARADFLSEGAFTLGTRNAIGTNDPSGPTFGLSTPDLIASGIDARGPGGFKNAGLKFALGPVLSVAGSVTSATLTLNVTVSQSSIGQSPTGIVALGGFGSNTNPLALSDFGANPLALGSRTIPTNIGSPTLPTYPPLVFDVTSFVRNLVASGSTAAGFQIDDPVADTLFVFSNNANLTINYSASVPEPASVVMAGIGLGLALAVGRRRLGRRACPKG